MPKFNLIKTSFLAGEVSPKMDARTDLSIYSASCKRLLNFILQKQGGVARRPGTRIYPIFSAPSANSPGRLIPFVPSTENAFPIIFTEAGGLHACEFTDTALTQSDSVSPYSGSEVYALQYAQSVDTMWVVHGDHAPQKVTGLSGAVSIADIFSGVSSTDLVDCVPYRDKNTTSTWLKYTGTLTAGGTGTLSASTSVFNAGHVGAIFKLQDSSSPNKIGAVQITGYTSGTSVSATVINQVYITSGTSTTLWWESAWSDYRGWPRTVAFYKGRLIMGGNEAEPDTIWASYLFNYRIFNQEMFGTTTGVETTRTDSFARSFPLNAQQLNAIQWMSAGKSLVVGTFGQEFVINDVGDMDTTPDFNVETSYGSQRVMPQRAGYSVMFSQRSGTAVREMYFNFDSQTYTSDELSVLADHMPGEELSLPSSIRTMAWQESASTLWVNDDTGGLYACTRDKALGITGWHRHKLGGVYADIINGDQSPIVNSVCVVPSASTQYDEVFFSTTRTIDGAPYYAVEVMRADFKLDALDNDNVNGQNDDADAGLLGENAPVWVDMAGTRVFDTPQTSLSGYYFANADVAGLADGKCFATTTNGSGDVTLPFATTKLTLGLPYTSQLQTQRIDGGGAALGTAQGAIKRIDRVVFRFLRTCSAKIGATFESMRSINFRPAGSAPNSVIPLYTGDSVEAWSAGSDRDGYICVEVSDALPCTILAITARGEVNE